MPFFLLLFFIDLSLKNIFDVSFVSLSLSHTHTVCVCVTVLKFVPLIGYIVNDGHFNTLHLFPTGLCGENVMTDD